jgi:hypothetical protein
MKADRRMGKWIGAGIGPSLAALWVNKSDVRISKVIVSDSTSFVNIYLN